MSAATANTVSSLQELLDQVRACIGDVSPGVIVSLTIDVTNREERRVLRLAVNADDCDINPPANHLHTSPCTTSSPPLRNDTDMDQEASEVTGGRASLNQPQKRRKLLEAERETMEEDQEEGADDCEENDEALASATCGSMEGLEESSVLSSPHVGEHVALPSRSPSRTDENIRRSARKQFPVDRLVYEAAQPRETGGTTSKRQRTEVLASASAAAPDTTDRESDSSGDSDAAENSSSPPSFSSSSSSSSSSSAASLVTRPSSSKNRKKCCYRPTARANEEKDNDEEEEQVAALVKKFEDAYASRDNVSLDQTSKEAVLTLGRDVLSGSSSVGTASTVCIDSASYQQHAVKLDHLIATSSAARMLRYYLKGALAAKLKLNCRTKYVHAARTLLRLKSTADICAYPAFYDFVQRHCSAVTRGGADVEAWLKEPVFLVDLGWSEWRRYLSKRHCWIVSTALERFNASLLPVQDWMQRGWVEEYNDDWLGRSVRATRNIPLPPARGRQRSFGDAVVADLNIFAQAQALVALDNQQQQQHGQIQDDGDRSSASSSASRTAFSSASPPSVSAYRFEWNSGKHMLNAEKLWVGKINHLPEKHCNVRLSSNGKLVQVKPIRAGEALTFDY